MLPLLITRADFASLVRAQATITADDLRAPIRDAHDLDLPGVGLTAALVEQLAALPPLGEPLPYGPAVAYAVGQLAGRAGLIWRALAVGPLPAPPVAAEGTAATATAQWAPAAPETLLTLYVRPWLVARAWGYWLLGAGTANVAAGLVVHTDPQGTFQPIGSVDRSRIIAENNRRVSIYESRLRSFLATYRTALGLADTTACGAPARGRSGGVWSV